MINKLDKISITFFEVVHDVISFDIDVCLLELDVAAQLLNDVRFGRIWVNLLLLMSSLVAERDI